MSRALSAVAFTYSPSMRRVLQCLVLAGIASCSRPSAPPGDSPIVDGVDGHAATQTPSASQAEAGPRTGSTPEPPLPASSAACPTVAGGPSCVRFATLEDAFTWVLAHNPAILAIGEAHAQKGTENIPSATKRFTQTLLPLLQGRGSDVLVEAWAGDPKCQRDVKAVASAQAPVKQAQAQENPNEYLALGTRARALGMVPDLLRPSCDDYASLADAGADVISASLDLIKRLTQETATRLYSRNQGLANGKIVVTYGGAMHNDLFPAEELRRYSFGQELSTLTAGRYVELDLIVPEYVKKTDAWEKLPWYSAWQSESGPKAQTRLYRLSDSSFVLVFGAEGQGAGADAAPPAPARPASKN